MIKQVIIKIIIILLLIQLLYTSNSYASIWGNLIDQGENFINVASNNSSATINSMGMKAANNALYNTISSLGVVIAVIIGAILGIMYIFGSIEQQVKVKESLIPYVIACIVIFAAFEIWKLLINVFSNI